jgi:hypothetical protein
MKGVDGKDKARSREQGILSALRKEHDLAKAIKSDNAAVPKHLWDIATCRGLPSTAQTKALTMLRMFMLRVYWEQLWQEIRSYMRCKHGDAWITKMRDTRRNRSTAEEADAMKDILRRAAKNKWFQCPVGSRLLFFCFPECYHTQALRGIRIMFTDKGPSSWQ